MLNVSFQCDYSTSYFILDSLCFVALCAKLCTVLTTVVFLKKERSAHFA